VNKYIKIDFNIFRNYLNMKKGIILESYLQLMSDDELMEQFDNMLDEDRTN
jgi:hypothetical protein